ncbi:hypothetical protein C8A03DRAFT_37220 [Achaetomium macrosporum]|uniref:Uncharacterized protein n=1 Tax=Achaetomium macrosporum TaxID=79813 RepID=A0AAN7C3Y7_9PEZI|nr:hypothetical protein C8A03DRAFT_37220 [Achaetomium macrosporum]
MVKRENEREEPSPTLDTILQAIEEHIKGYNNAVNLEQRQQDENHHAAVLNALRGGETELKLLAETQASNRTLLLEVIMESKQRAAEIAALRQQLEATHISRHTAVVTLTVHLGATPVASSLRGLSAISVLSSTLVTSLMQAYPDSAVVVHFFCGMHASPKDAWYGPSGLLLMKLDAKDPDMRTWNLDYINDRRLLQNLEEHSLMELCSVLHSLLYEFPADTCIYCIVDSISCFDICRLHNDLNTVTEQLRIIVNDTKLVTRNW